MSCNMFVRAASTIASESSRGCERTPRDAWDGNGKGGAGAVLPAFSGTMEVEAAAAASGGDISTAESKT